MLLLALAGCDALRLESPPIDCDFVPCVSDTAGDTAHPETDDLGDLETDSTNWPDPDCKHAVLWPGDFEPADAADWEGFCAAGYNAIEGSLFADDVPLDEPCLCDVGGDLQASLSGAAVTRSGLASVRRAGSIRSDGQGDYLANLAVVDRDAHLGFLPGSEVTLPLRYARALTLEGAEARVELPELVEVETLSSDVGELSAPALERAWTIDLGGSEARSEFPVLVSLIALELAGRVHVDSLESTRSIVLGPDAVELDAPSLVAVDALSFEGVTSALGGELPTLGWVGSLVVTGSSYSGEPTRYLPAMPALTDIDELDLSACRQTVFASFSALKRVSGRLRVSASDADLSALPLDSAGTLVLRTTVNARLPSMQVDSLTLEKNAGLEDLDGLEELRAMSGSLQILENEDLAHLDWLGALERVDGNLGIRGNPSVGQDEALVFVDGLEVAGNVSVEDNDP